MSELQTFLSMRKRMRDFGESLGNEQLLRIPAGFNNNIAWNLGHLALTQQVLCYKLSGLPMPIEEEYVQLFGKGSSPADWEEAPDMAAFLPRLTELAEGYLGDLEQGLFKSFTPYETAVKIQLGNLDEAFAFNQLHEGIHLGYAMAQRRALG